jgi:hypothetical protein
MTSSKLFQSTNDHTSRHEDQHQSNMAPDGHVACISTSTSRTISWSLLPTEIIIHILRHCPTKTLPILFKVSKLVSTLAIQEWDRRLPPLPTNTILYGTARSNTIRGGPMAKVVLFARVLGTRSLPYTGSRARIEFLVKKDVDSQVRNEGSGLIFVSQVPVKPLTSFKTKMGTKVWVRRREILDPLSYGGRRRSSWEDEEEHEHGGGGSRSYFKGGGVVFDVKYQFELYGYELAMGSVALVPWNGAPVEGFMDNWSQRLQQKLAGQG